MWTGLDTLTDGKAVAHWVQEKPSTPIIFDTPHVEPKIHRVTTILNQDFVWEVIKRSILEDIGGMGRWDFPVHGLNS
jgi:hypothetical protein